MDDDQMESHSNRAKLASKRGVSNKVAPTPTVELDEDEV